MSIIGEKVSFNLKDDKSIILHFASDEFPVLNLIAVSMHSWLLAPGSWILAPGLPKYFSD
jgi:hypothetical protein